MDRILKYDFKISDSHSNLKGHCDRLKTIEKEGLWPKFDKLSTNILESKSALKCILMCNPAILFFIGRKVAIGLDAKRKRALRNCNAENQKKTFNGQKVFIFREREKKFQKTFILKKNRKCNDVFGCPTS